MADDELVAAMKAGWTAAVAIEPGRGGVSLPELEQLEARLAAIAAVQPAGLAALPDDDARREVEGTIATIYARCAACSIAAGDSTRSDRWLAAAQAHSHDDDQQAELAAARANQERYRMLVHGRNLIANHREGEARKLWKQLMTGDDAIARAAADEHKAPRPIGDGAMPTLFRWNGIGLGFYGRRDHWPDGSYATTHCFCVLYVPLVPVGAYRVRDADGGYMVMAREQLSGFAKIARLVIALGIVGLITGLILNSYLNDPARLAKQRWDRALDTAGIDPEVAMKQIDDELAGSDLLRVDNARIERAGARIVELSAGYVPKPITPDSVDQATKVVRRYEGLTDSARNGAARDAMLAALDGWIDQIGDKVERADARVELLQHAQRVADPSRAGKYESLVARSKVALASAKAQDWPVEALAILVDPATSTIVGDPVTDKIVDRLVESPSLLVDARADLDAWLAVAPDAERKRQVTDQRATAAEGRIEAEAQGVTRAQLAAMEKKRPWDQFVQVALAKDELANGKLDAAAARLDKLGSPGLLVRDARYILGRIASSQGKLDKARQLLSSLLGPRLQRFTAAGAALDEAIKKVQKRLERMTDAQLPSDLLEKLRTAPKDEQRELLGQYMRKTMSEDPEVIRRREELDAFADVVPAAIATGAVELRLAHALTGAARDAMLKEAERTFLAIRAEAQGQPEYRLHLGEIYARLGKTKESEAEFAAVLGGNDGRLKLEVANTYRDLGNIERTKQVATDLYEHAPSDKEGTELKYGAALLMGLTSREDEAETWLKRGDPQSQFVKISLLELEASKLRRQGRFAECGAKFAAAAKAWLGTANAASNAGYNNAALAYERAFSCTGDLSTLADSEATLDKAYKAHPEDPIVTFNYASTLDYVSSVRQLAKRIDVRALRPGSGEAERLISALLASSERERVLADLAADPAQAKSADLFAQYEVLAPSSPHVYQSQFEQADRRRDETVAAAIVERARRAKLDTSELIAARERWRSGSEDAKTFEQATATIARLDETLARPGLDAKTRATARYLQLYARLQIGVYKRDTAIFAKAREDALAAMAGWSVFDTNSSLVALLLDEAGLAAGADAWVDLRRSRAVGSALAKAPQALVDKVKASPQWREVVTYVRADHSRPSVDDVRLARLLGDAELEKRASAVFDDKLARLSAELAVVMSPKDEVAAEDLAFIAKH